MEYKCKLSKLNQKTEGGLYVPSMSIARGKTGKEVVRVLHVVEEGTDEPEAEGLNCDNGEDGA